MSVLMWVSICARCSTATCRKRSHVECAALLATDCTKSCHQAMAAPAQCHQQTFSSGCLDDSFAGSADSAAVRQPREACCHAEPRCWQTESPTYCRRPPNALPPAAPAANATRGSGAPTMAGAQPSSAAAETRFRRRPVTCKRRSSRPATRCLPGVHRDLWQATTEVCAVLPSFASLCSFVNSVQNPGSLSTSCCKAGIGVCVQPCTWLTALTACVALGSRERLEDLGSREPGSSRGAAVDVHMPVAVWGAQPAAELPEPSRLRADALLRLPRIPGQSGAGPGRDLVPVRGPEAGAQGRTHRHMPSARCKTQ